MALHPTAPAPSIDAEASFASPLRTLFSIVGVILGVVSLVAVLSSVLVEFVLGT